MKRSFVLTTLIILAVTVVAQPSKKPAQQPPSSQPDVNRIIEDAMKKEGMSQKEIDEAMKMMGQGTSMAKQAGFDGNMPGAYTLPQFPVKQTALLSKIPVLSTIAERTAYINNLFATCKRNIEPSLAKSIDAYFEKQENNKGALVNFPALLLFQDKQDAAIYAALKLSTGNPDKWIFQNNLAVLLHQSGYPERAIPIFKNILTTYNLPEILNNLAQCYLSLGDKDNATKFFILCIQKSPEHSAAHCGMAVIKAHEGNIAEATEHTIHSLKNEYSEVAEALVKQHKMKVKFSDVKSAVKEYFNPQKFKPVPSATSTDDVELVNQMRDDFYEKFQDWQRKADKFSDEQNQQKEGEALQQFASRFRGYTSKGPLAAKARFMIQLLEDEMMHVNPAILKGEYVNIGKSYYKQLESRLTEIDKESHDNLYEDCKARLEAVNKYLVESSKNLDGFQKKTMYKLYDWLNQEMYWKRFLLSSEEYKAHVYQLINEFFRQLDGYKDVQQIYPAPLNIVGSCRTVKQLEIKKPNQDSVVVEEEEDCPIKIEVGLDEGKVKWDCNGWEVEGGEIIIVGVEKKYKSGEITFFLGLGYEKFLKTMGTGIELGGKAGSFIKIDKNNHVLDCGNKLEIGGEAGLGPFTTEAKINGTMGWQSGVKLEPTGLVKDLFQPVVIK